MAGAPVCVCEVNDNPNCEEEACPALAHCFDVALVCSTVCIDVSSACSPVTANGLIIGSTNKAQKCIFCM